MPLGDDNVFMKHHTAFWRMDNIYMCERRRPTCALCTRSDSYSQIQIRYFRHRASESYTFQQNIIVDCTKGKTRRSPPSWSASGQKTRARPHHVFSCAGTKWSRTPPPFVCKKELCQHGTIYCIDNIYFMLHVRELRRKHIRIAALIFSFRLRLSRCLALLVTKPHTRCAVTRITLPFRMTCYTSCFRLAFVVIELCTLNFYLWFQQWWG